MAPANHVIGAICLSRLHQIYGAPHLYFVSDIVYIANVYDNLNIIMYGVFRKMTYPSKLSISQSFCFSIMYKSRDENLIPKNQHEFSKCWQNCMFPILYSVIIIDTHFKIGGRKIGRLWTWNIVPYGY